MNQHQIIGIGSSFNPVQVEPSRRRQTPPPNITFKKILTQGAQVLLSGARVATRIVGGPVLSAAISKVDGGIATPLDDVQRSGNAQEDLFKSFHEQRLTDELKLLELQDQIQRDNRQVTLISNVMKARHETAKSAIANVRS